MSSELRPTPGEPAERSFTAGTGAIGALDDWSDLRRLFERVPARCAAIAPDSPRFTILAVTDAFCREAGRSRGAIIGRGLFELYAELGAELPALAGRRSEAELRASLAEAVRTGAEHSPPLQRFDITHADGRSEPRFWATTNVAVPGDDGAVRYLLHHVDELTDVVHRREAVAAALRESEQRYRSLFDSIDNGFCVIELLFDDDGRPVDYTFIETNPAFVEQTGLVDAPGRTAREMVPALEPHWFEIYGAVALTGEPRRFESGSEAMGRWFDVYAFRLGPAEERKVALLFTDVTAMRAATRERDRLLRELEVERTRLAYVFRHAPAFLAVLRGPDHVFDLVNEAYYQLVGHRELVGLPIETALPEIAEQGFRSLLDRIVETGEPYVGREVPVRLARSAGGPMEERFVDFVYLPLWEGEGAPAGVIAHGTDVTEQVQARRDVERLLRESEEARAEAETARAEAEAANRSKGEFLAVMSHELRTPLNAIGGYAELIEMGIRGPVTHQQQEDLRRIQTSQRHLLGLINEVLNYARLETGGVHYELSDVHVREALTAAEALVAPQARAKGLVLLVAACQSQLVVRADAEKLRQILVNLLSNAIKFTDRGGRIEMSCSRSADRILMHVHDTGIGVPPDRQGAIFDPFVQVRAGLTRPHEGTGLGLAISRDLARGMGGDLVLVESTPGRGSTFTLELPEA